jgi:hypothetical protein
MLTKPVPSEVRQLSHYENAIVDCGDSYAVKRSGQDWKMERKRSHAEVEADFYRTTSKAEILDGIRRDWEKEYQNNVKDGKIREDRKKFDIVGFIGNPDYFDRQIEWLEKFNGELTPADKAWIINTRKTITKYHILYEQEVEKDFFRRYKITLKEAQDLMNSKGQTYED